mmetsp:Transcript_125230/g.348448  ORF Transcript_125230/g.348448 Transcript_125230/m.348448 type:complete len:301 (+) Transcript_125230:650-1552(+)
MPACGLVRPLRRQARPGQRRSRPRQRGDVDLPVGPHQPLHPGLVQALGPAAPLPVGSGAAVPPGLAAVRGRRPAVPPADQQRVVVLGALRPRRWLPRHRSPRSARGRAPGRGSGLHARYRHRVCRGGPRGQRPRRGRPAARTPPGGALRGAEPGGLAGDRLWHTRGPWSHRRAVRAQPRGFKSDAGAARDLRPGRLCRLHAERDGRFAPRHGQDGLGRCRLPLGLLRLDAAAGVLSGLQCGLRRVWPLVGLRRGHLHCRPDLQHSPRPHALPGARRADRSAGLNHRHRGSAVVARAGCRR